jgi:hypothetical protein
MAIPRRVLFHFQLSAHSGNGDAATAILSSPLSAKVIVNTDLNVGNSAVHRLRCLVCTHGFTNSTGKRIKGSASDGLWYCRTGPKMSTFNRPDKSKRTKLDVSCRVLIIPELVFLENDSASGEWLELIP